MTRKFKSFHEWMQTRDKEFYITLVEFNDGPSDRRSFLKQAAGALGAAALGIHKKVGAEETSGTSSSEVKFPVDLKARQYGVMVKFLKDDNGKNDYSKLVILAPVPDWVREKTESIKDLNASLEDFEKSYRVQILTQTYLLLKNTFKNTNIKSSTILIKGWKPLTLSEDYEETSPFIVKKDKAGKVIKDINGKPKLYMQDKNIKFVMNVTYHDRTDPNLEALTIEQLQNFQKVKLK